MDDVSHHAEEDAAGIRMGTRRWDSANTGCNLSMPATRVCIDVLHSFRSFTTFLSSLHDQVPSLTQTEQLRQAILTLAVNYAHLSNVSQGRCAGHRASIIYTMSHPATRQ